MRDFYLQSYFSDSEIRFLLSKYPPSPVPAIWLKRIIMKYIIDFHIYPEVRFKDFEQLTTQCSRFKNIAPPKGYLEGDFRYKK